MRPSFPPILTSPVAIGDVTSFLYTQSPAAHTDLIRTWIPNSQAPNNSVLVPTLIDLLAHSHHIALAYLALLADTVVVIAFFRRY